mmetsp:Transcript_24092/g.45032  ORF Transcript_24092/g.45032 Transcript_24092/m.45032 type:complete len:538 (-) Transcript_24092:355-1968(-)
MRVAIVGCGISGIATAVTLQRKGHEVKIYEGSSKIGGQWNHVYPGAKLQNVREHYHLAEFPWSEPLPGQHPTAKDILRYLSRAVEHYKLDIELDTKVVSAEETRNENDFEDVSSKASICGWSLTLERKGKAFKKDFDYLVVATGHYYPSDADDKHIRTKLPGIAEFIGDFLSSRSLESFEGFRNKNSVVVLGNGKTALDFIDAISAPPADSKGKSAPVVHHVFREARWPVFEYFFGLVHYKYILWTRVNTVMIPGWMQPSEMEHILHKYLWPVVWGFWGMLQFLLTFQYFSYEIGHGFDVWRRIARVFPWDHSLVYDMRNAAAILPRTILPRVASGQIVPHKAKVKRVTPEGVELSTGESIQCDAILVAYGNAAPTLDFLPKWSREALQTSDPRGVQLHRHVIHPQIQRLAFAGHNHGFLHVPLAEVSALWLSAVMKGELKLPPPEKMLLAIEHVRKFKSERIAHEPTANSSVNTRYQSYLDGLLLELGLNPHRKSNALLEWLTPYGAEDYSGIVAERNEVRKRGTAPKKCLTDLLF